MTERVYFSINKLMSYINENKVFEQSLRGRIENPYSEPRTISLWFESNETFVNKFKQVVIKPIAITLRGSDKPVRAVPKTLCVTLTHQTLINAFNNKQPFVSFSKNKNRSVPKTKNGELPFLSIDMTQKEFDGKKFYPSRTSFTTNKEQTLLSSFKAHRSLNRPHSYFCSACLIEH